jgi:hypothetical protein
MKKITIGILSLVLFSCSTKEKKDKPVCKNNIQWRNVDWGTTPVGLKLLRHVSNVDIYQNDTDKLCIGEIDVDSIRYKYFGKDLQEVNVYYAQDLVNEFDSCFEVLSAKTSYHGANFETFELEIRHLADRNKKISIDTALNTKCCKLYKKWAEKESKIFKYLNLKYGSDSLENTNGVWEDCRVSVVQDCIYSKIRYTNYYVEVMQRHNLDSLMIVGRKQRDSIDKDNLNKELGKCSL